MQVYNGLWGCGRGLTTIIWLSRLALGCMSFRNASYDKAD